jgi:signal transduction histidine kinase
VNEQTGSQAAQAVTAVPETSTDWAPWRRDGLLTRIAPFAALAGLAEASLALPSAPISAGYAVTSVLLLAATAAAIAFLPWDRLPSWTTAGVPVLYTLSVFALIEAAGGSQSGLGLVLFSPLIWTALFHRWWESAVATVVVLGAMLGISLTPHPATTAELTRRMFFSTAVAAMIALVGHGLRVRVNRSRRETARAQDRLRELSLLADRDRIGRSLHDSVIQRLFGAGLSLQGIAQLADQPEVTSRINDVVQNLDDSIKLLRQSIFGLEQGVLEPPSAGPGPLEAGLRRRILDVSSELAAGLGVMPEVSLDGPLDTAVQPHAATQLLGTLREALTRSDARVTQVAVTVAVAGDSVTLTITDDGASWTTARAADAGRDLSRLCERASRVGGTVTTEPVPGGLTRLIWQAPLAVTGDLDQAALIGADPAARDTPYALVRMTRRAAPSR